MIGVLRRRGTVGVFSITYNLTNVSKQGTATEINSGMSFQDVLSTSDVMISVAVTMGGIDITASAYNASTKAISIPSVKGNIIVTALASPVITFDDSTVKSLCVTNWGGNYLQNEITEYEAAQVTSLNDVFRGNTQITSFDELRFFTGITSLYISGNSTASQGEFYNCTNLASIKLPFVSLVSTSGAFRNTKIVVLDLSPLSQTGNMNGTCHNNTYLTKVILPSITFSGISWAYTFRTCNNLTTIEIDGTADFSNVTTFNVPFYGCSNLETITGSVTGIKADISFASSSKLTRESLLVIINGLAEVETQKTLTLSSTTFALLSDEDIDIAIEKNWEIAS